MNLRSLFCSVCVYLFISVYIGSSPLLIILLNEGLALSLFLFLANRYIIPALFPCCRYSSLLLRNIHSESTLPIRLIICLVHAYFLLSYSAFAQIHTLSHTSTRKYVPLTHVCVRHMLHF